MPESSAPSRLLLLKSLPPEILDHILQTYIDDAVHCSERNNIASALVTCKIFRDLLLSKLYASVHIHSMAQLLKFIDRESGAQNFAPMQTKSLVINLPGVPGRRNEHETNSDRQPVSCACRALMLCGNVRSVSFEFFSIRQPDRSSVHREGSELIRALQGSTRLERLRWTPPQQNANAIKGLSIVIVDQLVAPLSWGLSTSSRLESLELWNIMLDENDGGAQLSSLLIDLSTKRAQRGIWSSLELTLRSVTNLDPNAVAELALARPPIKVNLADAFVASIWGSRVDKQAVEACMRQSLTSTHSSSVEQTLFEASANVRYTVLQGGIAGSQNYTD